MKKKILIAGLVGIVGFILFVVYENVKTEQIVKPIFFT